jgi:hypothetical protein
MSICIPGDWYSALDDSVRTSIFNVICLFISLAGLSLWPQILGGGSTTNVYDDFDTGMGLSFICFY